MLRWHCGKAKRQREWRKFHGNFFWQFCNNWLIQCSLLLAILQNKCASASCHKSNKRFSWQLQPQQKKSSHLAINSLVGHMFVELRTISTYQGMHRWYTQDFLSRWTLRPRPWSQDQDHDFYSPGASIVTVSRRHPAPARHLMLTRFCQTASSSTPDAHQLTVCNWVKILKLLNPLQHSWTMRPKVRIWLYALQQKLVDRHISEFTFKITFIIIIII